MVSERVRERATEIIDGALNAPPLRLKKTKTKQQITAKTQAEIREVESRLRSEGGWSLTSDRCCCSTGCRLTAPTLHCGN